MSARPLPPAGQTGNGLTEGNPTGAGNGTSLPPTPPPLPPQAADHTPRPVPANADEALDISRRLHPEVGSPGGPASLLVHEFDLGYLIQVGWPLPEDPTAPPAEPGGSHIIIAKATGEVTYVRNHPPEQAMEHYRRFRARSMS
ncbi:hypothetical protein [Streptomyces lydicus]|uniref:hypothetical protein n=1 Tax=Streptomyces lydicus TaxID=47763 RepID=UPI0037B5150D